MIKCPSCGSGNLDGSQYCDECGTALKAGEGRMPETPNFQPQQQYAEVSGIQQASVTSVGIPIYMNEAENGIMPENAAAGSTDSNAESEAVGSDGNHKLPKGVHATLLIERGASVGMEFRLTSDESYIGRWDADNGIFPDVDLDTHDPEAKVSRRHARIIKESGKYSVEDLGSTNGTFINRGRRLIPGARQPLNDGDEIIVGKTFLRFHIV